jgi:hypothetical protein
LCPACLFRSEMGTDTIAGVRVELIFVSGVVRGSVIVRAQF